jgi:hypothetical protein
VKRKSATGDKKTQTLISAVYTNSPPAPSLLAQRGGSGGQNSLGVLKRKSDLYDSFQLAIIE